MIELREPELEDDYPVFAGYLYVVDGRIVESNVSGYVRDLKRDQRNQGCSAEVVCRCDIVGRSETLNAKEVLNGVVLPIKKINNNSHKSSKTVESRKNKRKKNRKRKK